MSCNPEIGALGGQSVGFSEEKFPDWWGTYKNSYAVGKQADFSKDVSNRYYLWGAGMVSRKSILFKVFNTSVPLLFLNRNVNKLMRGMIQSCV